MRYALRVARLLACPFCRSLFAGTETRQCPECGVKLVPMENLPESLDVAADELEAGEIVLPEQRRLPWNYFGRNRGALLLIALLGLGLFFAPWVELRMPEFSVRSGFDLARGRAGWLWGGAAGWLVTLPLVWTRRTIQRLRGGATRDDVVRGHDLDRSRDAALDSAPVSPWPTAGNRLALGDLRQPTDEHRRHRHGTSIGRNVARSAANRHRHRQSRPRTNELRRDPALSWGEVRVLKRRPPAVVGLSLANLRRTAFRVLAT